MKNQKIRARGPRLLEDPVPLRHVLVRPLGRAPVVQPDQVRVVGRPTEDVHTLPELAVFRGGCRVDAVEVEQAYSELNLCPGA